MVKPYPMLCSLKRLLFAFTFVGLIQTAALAQVESGRAANLSNGEVRAASSAKAGDEIDERLKLLEAQLIDQGRSLTEMRAIIAEQQRQIEKLTATAAINTPAGGDAPSARNRPAPAGGNRPLSTRRVF